MSESNAAPLERPLTPRTVGATREKLIREADAKLLEQLKAQVTRERILGVLTGPAPYALNVDCEHAALVGQNASAAVQHYLDGLVSCRHYKHALTSRENGRVVELSWTRIEKPAVVTKTTNNEQIHIAFCLCFCLLAGLLGFAISQFLNRK